MNFWSFYMFNSILYIYNAQWEQMIMPIICTFFSFGIIYNSLGSPHPIAKVCIFWIRQNPWPFGNRWHVLESSWKSFSSLLLLLQSGFKAMNKLGFEILICPTGGLGSNSMLIPSCRRTHMTFRFLPYRLLIFCSLLGWTLVFIRLQLYFSH